MDYIKFDRLSRRQFLRGTGGTLLAIPFMPSLSEAFGQGNTGSAIRRFVSIQMEDGYLGPWFYPAYPSLNLTAVNAYTKTAPLPVNMSYIMDSKFDDLRNSMIICNNVDGPFYTGHNDYTVLSTQMSEMRKDAPRYTVPTPDMRYASIDQHIAKHVYGTKVPQIDILNLGLRYFSTNGTSTAGSLGVNALGEYARASAYGNLGAAWDYIFGQLPGDPLSAARLQQERRFVVDNVLSSYREFLNDRRLSAADKIVMQAHIDEVAALQTRINSVVLTQCSAPLRSNLSYSEGPNGPNWPQVARIFFDMIVIALKCDVTRVANFRLAPNTLHRSEAQYGTGHHDISHTNLGANPNIATTWANMDRDYFAQIHYFVSRLQAEGLLKDTLVFCSNEIGNQANVSSATTTTPSFDGHHDSYNLMAATFGLTDVLNTGYYYWFDRGVDRGGRWNRKQGVAYNEFLVTLMHAFGVPEASWKKPNTAGYGDYRGDQWGQLNTNIISPANERGKPIPALLK